MRWLRRLLVLCAIVAVGVFLVRRRADANVETPVRPAGEDQWPPIDVDRVVSDAVVTQDSVTQDSVTEDSVTDATVALERPTPAWVVPTDGTCPLTHPIKVNGTSGIFHVPGGRFYDRTVPTRCYAEAEDATADGYRAAKA